MKNGYARIGSVVVGVFVAVGCTNGGSDGGGGQGGNGGAPAAGPAFAIAATPTTPIDAAPDAAGATIFFLGDGGEGLGLYSVAATGGAAKKILVGAPLASPAGLAFLPSDGKVYVADKTAGLLAVNVASGAATAVAGAEASQPLALDVDDASKTIYFTSGKDGTLYSLPAAGGTPKALSEPGKFVDAEGVAVAHKASAETVYVADRKDGKAGTLYKVTGGKSTPLGGAFVPGTPSGIALPLDESVIAVSALDATGASSEVDFFDTSTGARTTYNDAIKQNHGSGGLHRAYNANIFAWCGIAATSGGVVYRVTL